ncbi:hypothetical protein [Streptomyces sp. Ru71]|uniref:VMAP-C domain-containing protein n=1 Tax=Streptomyces sp. Ru71 TaxID=2080746 RepID=UPI002155FEF0|nr:hypothetical protein [Streptomyces sp. Ru71]
MNELKMRQALLVRMGEKLRLGHPFNVAEDPEYLAHLDAIVRAAHRDGALEALCGALAQMYGDDDIDVAWLELAVTALTGPPGHLPADVLLALVVELRCRPKGFGAATVARFLAERRAQRRPLDGTSLPQVLLKLYDSRVPAHGPAEPREQLLRFLRMLAAQTGPSGPLAALLAEITGAAPGEPVAPAADGERQVIIQIRVEEEDAPSDLPPAQRRYSLRGYHYERVGDDRPVFLGSQSGPGLFTGDELTERGRDFLTSWREPADAARGVTKRVEFLLPHSLLGHPAEAWPGGPAGRPLSRSCQVVVRSLIRYRDSMVHDGWIRRWNALDRDRTPADALQRIGWLSTRAPADGPACPDPAAAQPWKCPEGKYPPLRLTRLTDLVDWLSAHPDLGCLGLGTPYDHDDDLIRQAVDDALLEDGIPVMVWRRDAGDPHPLLDALRAGQPPADLAELPHRVHQARRRGRHDTHSVHNQITLLWDDPTCVFSGQDQPMPGTRAAGEGAA